MKVSISEVKEQLKNSRIYYRYFDFKFKLSELYENQMDFYSKLLGSANLIFDVGANIGNKAYIFKSFSNRVILFEPQLFCLEKIRIRFKGDPKIFIEPVALGGKTGIERIYLSNHHTLASLSKDFINRVGKKIFPDSTWNDYQEVTVDTLDDMIMKYGLPDYIKIDVEGYELEVLSGLNYKVPIISFEFTPNEINKVESCLSLLNNNSNKYQYNFTLGENLDFQLEEPLPKDDFLTSPKLRKVNSFGDIYAFSI